MPITMQGASPEQTAREYAIKFRLPYADPDVQWVRNHPREYLELVKIKNDLCDRNGIDSDKFAIAINRDPELNASAKIDAARLLHLLVGSRYNEFDPSKVNILDVNTGIFHPGFTREDREFAMGHEMAHNLGLRLPQQQQQVAKESFFKNFSWTKKTWGEIFGDTAKDLQRDEELRADKVGAELLGCNVQQAVKALQDLDRLSGGRGSIKLEDVKSVDHPPIPVRVTTLKAEEKEINAFCKK